MYKYKISPYAFHIYLPKTELSTHVPPYGMTLTVLTNEACEAIYPVLKAVTVILNGCPCVRKLDIPRDELANPGKEKGHEIM